MTKQLTLLGQGSLYKAKPYEQKYWATPPNHWLQLFQAHYHRCRKSSPWPCNLLWQTFVKDCAAVKSSLNSSVAL